MLECMQQDTRPNVIQMRDAHKTDMSMALIYATQPNETQIASLAIGADKKIQPHTSPMQKPTTTQQRSSYTRLIEIDPLHATRIEPTTTHT